MKHIELFSNTLNERLKLPCGYTNIDLEGRFELVRAQETNLGNWLADVWLTEFTTHTDFVILNSGCLRNNVVL